MAKNKAKNTLSEEKLKDLLDAFINSVENISIDNIGEAESVYTTTGVFVKYSEHLLTQLEDEIVKSSNIHYYDGISLGKQIMNNIAEVIQESDKKDDELKKEIVSSVIGKILLPDKEYQCIIPVTGINVKETVTIGPVTFHSKKEKDGYLTELGTAYNLRLDRKPAFSGSFATLKVESGNKQSSAEFASQIVGATLDAFQVMKGQINQPLGLYVGDFPVQRTTEKLAVAKEDGMIIYKTDRFPAELELDSKVVESQYFNLIGSIQTKMLAFEYSKLSNLEKNIYNANKLFSVGISSDFGAVRFTNLMSGIEALLEQKTLDQSITTQVSENMAFLIGKNAAERLEIFDNMKAMYGTRSIFAHGDSIYIPNDSLVQLLVYVRRLISEITDKFEGLDQNGIQKYVKEIKFGLDD